jgi:hypothetical protein
MKKLILAVLVMATFGVNAGALEKFNKGWENIIKVKEYKIKPVKVGLILQQNYSLKTCRVIVVPVNRKPYYIQGIQSCKDLTTIFQKMKNEKSNGIKEVAK